MAKAVCRLRQNIAYRRDAFCEGLKAAGYSLANVLENPSPDDALLIWNRYGENQWLADVFERVGAKVFVTENGWLGKNWRDQQWFALSLDHHGGAGRWFPGGSERWDEWQVELKPWREGGERVILAQRGIGEPGIASPPGWAEHIYEEIGGRIRLHPGEKNLDGLPPLEEDLKDAGEVVTWNSGAALKCLTMGIPVRCAFDGWIGRSAACGVHDEKLLKDDDARLNMFRRLAWSMWTLDEIARGEPIKRLL